MPYLEPGTAIYPEDLDAWEKKTGVRISSGDVVLIRTGRWARRAEEGPVGPCESRRTPCVHSAMAKKRDIAVVGSDACLDVLPSAVDGIVQPVHLVLLVAMGTPIFDNFDFEALSAAAATRNRYTFLITAAPLLFQAAQDRR